MESFFVVSFILGVVFSFICSIIAGRKGRGAGIWFILGFFFSWIAFIIILCLPKTQEQKESDAIQSGQMFRCPACSELIRAKAIKCRYCGETFGSEDFDNL